MSRAVYMAAFFAMLWPLVHLVKGDGFSWWHILAGAAAGFVFGYGQYRMGRKKDVDKL
ncbi:MAG: hypothetical protein RIS47_2253 [Bacteroidota bacterium]|jgi:phosphotransferase system  glucose/maltose/N-acetylglucosamine-specific IIC component